MFCDGCGAALQPDQAFCGRCGKTVKAGGIHPTWPLRSRVQEHVRLLGILWIAMGAFDVVGGMMLFLLSNTIFREGGPGNSMFMHPLMRFLGTFVLVKAAAALAAGWGLLQRESWARVLALIVGFVALLNVPLGTALGVYTLWVLLPAQSEQEYEAQARAA